MAILLGQQDRLVASARANLIAAWFVVDASGSMAGGRWRQAQNGIRACLNQLSDNDFVGLITFADKVNVVDMNMKKELKSAGFFTMSPGGQTALYDGVAQMVLHATKTHLKLTQEVKAQALGIGVITYVVVLTDGDDTRSKLKLEETQVLLREINKLNNFKILFAGIMLDDNSRQTLRALGSVGDRDIEFRDLKSNDDIKDLFEHVTLQIQRQRQIVAVAVGNMNNYQNMNTYALPAGEGKVSDETLFGCLEEPGSCLCGLCCPCILFGLNVEKLEGGGVCCSHCCVYMCCHACGCCCCVHAPKRQKIQQDYGMQSPCEPLVATCCCPYCSLCQEARVLQSNPHGPGFQRMT
jgi:Cys-rich protein (TIGR01571 family)